MEFKKCKLKISQVLLHTMCFGHMDMEFSVIDAENLVVEVPNIGRVHFDAAVDADINGFIKLNAQSDEDHQIDLDTLYVDTIEIAECAPYPTLRIRYTFKQSEECWRYCEGRTHTMEMVKTNNELYIPGTIAYWALRLGVTCYIDPNMVSDEEILKAWGIMDSPAGVRAKMKRILETIQQ